jgi:hypothetical protein
VGRKAANDDKPFDFHLSGQTFSNIQRMLQFWCEYPDRDGLKAYLYRVAYPSIDSRQSGKRESSLQTWENDGAVPCVEDLLRKWGSGKFQLRLNDRKKPDNVQGVATCTFTLDDPDFPPVYNPVDLIVVGEAGEKNRPYIEKWLSAGYTIMEGQTNEVFRDRKGAKEKIPFASLRPPGESVEGKNDVDNKLVEKLIERGDRANGPRDEFSTALLKLLVTEREKQGDPMTQALLLYDRIKPQSDPNQVAVMKLLVDLVQSKTTAPAGAAIEPLEATRSTLGFLRELREGGFIDGGRDAGGGFWPAAFQALPSVLDFLKTGFTAAMLARGAGAAAPDVAGVEVAARAGDRRTAAPADSAEGGGETGMFGLPKEITMQALVDVGQDALHAYESEIDGASFAHSLFCRRNGEVLYNALAGMGKDGLLQALKMAAPLAGSDLAGALNNPEVLTRIEAWLVAFIGYGQTSAIDAADLA